MRDPEQVVKAGVSPIIGAHKSQDYKVFYANQSRMRMSQADIQVYFGLLTDDPNAPGTFTNEEIASVIMAPQHAKAFALSFLAAVNSYETAFGEIKLPAAMTKQLETLKTQLATVIPGAQKQE